MKQGREVDSHPLKLKVSILYKCVITITSGDENHLCGASLHKSHKISLNAHMGLVPQQLGLRSYMYHDSENITDC